MSLDERIKQDLRGEIADLLKRAEKAETNSLAWELTARTSGGAFRAQEEEILALSAQVVALRGALEAVRDYLKSWGDETIEAHEPERQAFEHITRTLSLPVPELAQAVQGVIEAAIRISPCNPMPDLKGNEFIGWKACTCYRCTALSALDSLIRKK